MAKSFFMTNTEPKIQYAVNFISLCSAIATFGLLIVLAFFKRQILNRVTLRFQGLIAFIDIFKHLLFFNLKNSSGPLCSFVAFSRNFLDVMYIFTNVLIALNIQLIYIHSILPKPVFEVFYLLGATGASFIINLIPFGKRPVYFKRLYVKGYDAYGSNKLGYCFLKEPLQHRIYFKILLRYLPMIPSFIYCLTIFSWVIISIYHRKKYLEEKFPSKQVAIYGEILNGREFIKKLFFRMGMYPLSAFVSFFPYIASNIFYDINGYFPEWMFFTLRFCNRSSGIMNLLSLLYDPHFQIALKRLYKNGLRIDQDNGVNLQGLGNIKKDDEEYLINFPGEESIRFEDFIKYL